jgi:hypothetical protein
MATETKLPHERSHGWLLVLPLIVFALWLIEQMFFGH